MRKPYYQTVHQIALIVTGTTGRAERAERLTRGSPTFGVVSIVGLTSHVIRQAREVRAAPTNCGVVAHTAAQKRDGRRTGFLAIKVASDLYFLHYQW